MYAVKDTVTKKYFANQLAIYQAASSSILKYTDP
jgi:hypothetical protein